MDGDLLEDILPVHAGIPHRLYRELACLVDFHEFVLQFDGLEGEATLAGLHGVVHKADAPLDALGVVLERLDELKCLIGAKDCRLVPADCVVVDIDLPQTPHHVKLVVLPICLRHLILVSSHIRKGEAVSDLQGLADVQAEKLTSDQIGEGALAVLHYLEDHLPLHLHLPQRRLHLPLLLGDGREAHGLPWFSHPERRWSE
mmetsp:Transcript_15706/g.43939  ORF Transcript_15706/g.43939 Transcript_15706/m.43939 type:complete len:201 (+) Transcript_15706:646-1248(+)